MLKAPRLFWYLLLAFFIVNLWQSGFTELFNDEAYYWYFSLKPDWGYFDHPPMVAWLISLGTALGKSELTLRLGSVLVSTCSVLLFWCLVGSPRKRGQVTLFFLVLWSMPLWNAFSFLALPDNPQLFFSLAFLLSYRYFLEEPKRWWWALGLSMALMLYSKYHGVLLPLLVIGSNWRLITQRYAWLAVGLGALLYVPHLLWLGRFDWIPVRFHLYERPNGLYNFSSFTLGYLLNLIVLFGLLSPWVYAAAWKPMRSDRFSAALKWIFWGIAVFFLVSSFNRRVQAQWTVAMCLPGALFLFERLLYLPRWRTWTVRILWVQGIILLYLRLALAFPALSPMVFESHYNRVWVDALLLKSGGAPVAFENSYVRAAKFHFYSGVPSLSINNMYYRKNQYSFDPIEERFRGSRVHYVSPFLRNWDYRIPNKGKDSLPVAVLDSFTTYRRLEIRIEDSSRPGYVRGQLINPYEQYIDLKGMVLHTGFCNRAKQMKGSRPNGPLTDFTGRRLIAPGDTLTLEVPLSKPTGIAQPSFLRLGISERGLPPGLNSNLHRLQP